MPDEPINEPGNTGEGDGGEPQESQQTFAEVFPEEHREMFQSFEDANGFVTHYKDLQGKVPQVPEKYEDIEGVEVNENNQEAFEALTKFSKEELGLTQDQFEKLTKAMVEHDTKLMNDLKSANDEEFEKVLEEQAKESEEELTKDWGNEYEPRLNQARNFLKAASDEEFMTYLDETGLGNDPRMVKFLYKMSTHFKEDAFTDGKIENNDVSRNQEGRPILKFQSMG